MSTQPFNDRDEPRTESVFDLNRVKDILQLKLQQGQFPDWTLGTTNTFYNETITLEYDLDCIPLNPDQQLANFIASEISDVIFDQMKKKAKRGGSYSAQQKLIEKGKFVIPNVGQLQDKLREYLWIVASPNVISQINLDDESVPPFILNDTYKRVGILDRTDDPPHKKVPPVKVWYGEVPRLVPAPTYLWSDESIAPDENIIYALCEDVFDIAYTIDQLSLDPTEEGKWRLTVPMYGTSVRVDALMIS